MTSDERQSLLTYSLIHPPLIGALAAAGHGSRILLADGNFPLATHVNPAAEVVHLNLRPGLLSVDDVLEPLLDAINTELAVVMEPSEGAVPAHAAYRSAIGADVPFEAVDRFAFYELARSSDVALVIATADQRLYANLLLTVGLVMGAES